MNIKTNLYLTIILLIVFFISSNTQAINQDSLYFAEHYTKQEVKITMRDGIKLFTAIYIPNNETEQHPIIIWRTPYSISPYGTNNFPTRRLESFFHFIKENYILVFQDVRGKFMSEGKYVNMRPYIPGKKSNKDIDESSDAYDTIDWLVNNVDNNNGNVGVWGISYPGFYAAMAAIDAHPALKAVSPQAPIANWFIGDDMHHNGAFTLMMNFNFFSVFGIERDTLTTKWPKAIQHPSPDAYSFFLKLGSLKNINEKYFHHKIAFWDSTVAHPNYDYYWKAKNTLPHFNNVSPAVLTVGGWFDGEDLFGTLGTYQSIEKKNNNINKIVMGPWPHGGWARSNGNSFGNLNFNSETGKFYRLNIELPFFNYYLKNKGTDNLPEAFMFETGKNKWNKFTKWPPDNSVSETIYLQPYEKLSFVKPSGIHQPEFDEYISNPHRPVPYTAKITDSKRFYYKEYLVEDQRFASRRPDVLIYESEPLKNNLTTAGPIDVDLFVSTSGTDCDWVVKVIDVFPEDEPDPQPNPTNVEMGNFQLLVRGDIFRSKYRNSFEKPEPMIPNEITEIKFTMNDVCHTFLKGHKIMIQIQSSWFPLFDMNPQKFTDIYNAQESDFQKAIQRVYYTEKYPSNITIKILK